MTGICHDRPPMVWLDATTALVGATSTCDAAVQFGPATERLAPKNRTYFWPPQVSLRE